MTILDSSYLGCHETIVFAIKTSEWQVNEGNKIQIFIFNEPT